MCVWACMWLFSRCGDGRSPDSLCSASLRLPFCGSDDALFIQKQIIKAFLLPRQDWRSWSNVCVLDRRGGDTTCASCASWPWPRTPWSSTCWAWTTCTATLWGGLFLSVSFAFSWGVAHPVCLFERGFTPLQKKWHPSSLMAKDAYCCDNRSLPFSMVHLAQETEAIHGPPSTELQVFCLFFCCLFVFLQVLTLTISTYSDSVVMTQYWFVSWV